MYADEETSDSEVLSQRMRVQESERITSQELEVTFKKFEESESQNQFDDTYYQQNSASGGDDGDRLMVDEAVAGSSDSQDVVRDDGGFINHDNGVNHSTDPYIDDDLIDSNQNGAEAVEEMKSLEDVSPVKRSKQLRKSEVKRYTSVWALFLQDERPKVVKDMPGISNREVIKEIGNRYKMLSAAEKQHYQSLVQADRERYERELREAVDDYAVALDTKGNTVNTSHVPLSTHLAFPVARVKRTMKMDPDVKNINKDALALFSKATELFCGYFLRRCLHASSLRGAKAVKEDDLIQAIYMTENLDFLRMDFPRKPSAASKLTPTSRVNLSVPRYRLTATPALKLSAGESSVGKDKVNTPTPSVGAKRRVDEAAHGASITNFFAVASAGAAGTNTTAAGDDDVVIGGEGSAHSPRDHHTQDNSDDEDELKSLSTTTDAVQEPVLKDGTTSDEAVKQKQRDQLDTLSKVIEDESDYNEITEGMDEMKEAPKKGTLSQ